MTDLREQALHSLPHGPEFRFLSRITELDPGHSGAAEFDLPEDAPYLKGHFPGKPMMPGVLLVEAAAQLAGAVAQSHPTFLPLSDLRLTALLQIKITGTVAPGDTLSVTASITGRFGSLIQARVEAKAGSTRILSGELVLSGAPADNP